MTHTIADLTAVDAVRNGSEAPAFGDGLPRFRPFSSLRDVSPEPDWLWHGFLAAGALTMLVGPPFAGKSTLTTGLLAALASGEMFLGRTTSPGTAVLLTEESDQQLRERAALFGLLDAEHRFLSRTSGVLLPEWDTLIEGATQAALEGGHGLLIIDTFPGLAGLEAEEENDSAAISKRLRPLLSAAGQGLAVLFLHHTNKSGGVRGSQAFRGIVDINIQLSRPVRRSTFTLTTESRYSGVPADPLRARLHKAPDGWFFTTKAVHATSTGRQTGATDTASRIMQALEQAGPDGLTYRDLGQVAGLSVHKAKRHLPGMYSAELVDRRGKGSKTDPYHWIPRGR